VPGRLPSYAELVCRSNYSFLNGASHPEELVARAQALRYAALAITDECSLAGVVRAHVQARQDGLPLIVGTLMQLQAGTPAPDAAPTPPTGPQLAVLAMSRRGYGNLAQWITVARRRAPKGEYIALMSDVEGRVPAAPMLAGLPDCLALLVVGAARVAPGAGDLFETLFAHTVWLKTWFGDRAALGLALHLGPHDALLLEAAQRVSGLTGVPIAAVGDVRMHARSRKPLLDVLTATHHRCTVAEAGHRLQPNAEAHLRPRQRLALLYRPEWLAHTLVLAGRCAFSLAELKYEYPREITPDGHTPTTWLRELTEAGVRDRFPQGLPPAVRAMIEHELALIAQLGYEPYFLTVSDLVRWARSQGILCQGRGSAANSAVCYCLGVTAVDPARSTLLFERFISAERNEPPDIDIDFEHQRREEVIQYIYRKYGRHRAALTGVVISYRPRSALRDVGRALGFDLDRIAAVAKSQHWFDGRSIQAERLRENGFDPDAPLCRLWVELTAQLIGFPRHLSQHPGGFVIARDDLARLVPVENAAMENRSVIQWDKDDLDALGLLKVDVLALGMLSAIKRALQLVSDKLGHPLELHQIPPEDKPSYEMLCRGDSVGTFQVESRAQMSMLPRLQPRCFYDLVIEVAIVRPGPIQGGMVHPYLRRRNGRRAGGLPQRRSAPGAGAHAGRAHLPGTGDAAGHPGGRLHARRSRSAAPRDGGVEAQGRPGPLSRTPGRPHGGQGLRAGVCRTHLQADPGLRRIRLSRKATPPVLRCWSMPAPGSSATTRMRFWLPCSTASRWAFTRPRNWCATRASTAWRCVPVDVNRSVWDCTLEDGPAALKAVRLGFNRISGLPQEAADRIVAARAESPFASAEDLARRAALDTQQLEWLAQADALRFLSAPRTLRVRPPKGCRRILGTAPTATATRPPGPWPAWTPAPRRCCAARARTKARPICPRPMPPPPCWPTTAPRA
jgi:error-prone DNA polymerase